MLRRYVSHAYARACVRRIQFAIPIGKLSLIDAAATAAQDGSVSEIAEEFPAHTVIYLAVLEVPALIVAAILGQA